MRSSPRYEGQPGFTLIELLIVVAIIAILAAIAVPNFLEAQTRSKVSRAKADMRTVRTGLEEYMVDFNHYPDPAAATWHTSLVDIPQLTTPVAFLTSFPRESFPRKDLTLDPAEFGDAKYYRYYNTTRWEETYPQLRAQGLKWFLMSHGPDLDVDVHDDVGTIAQDLLAGQNYMYYDPSNGTVSSGDIIDNNVKSAP
ncbi:prepilin-type N-terminal cleavage/methylation domain-containing protein [Candidatus Sumerlaeota bacterium]|nr:prepilin-type N-terminal cleavage/methylation domain-containing protein [Candidatus Sumerlaeota bacterium]